MVLSDAENSFEELALYDWDGLFYWSVKVDALSLRVWRYITAVDDEDLWSYFTS